MDPITPATLTALLGHLFKWLNQVARGNAEKKRRCLTAVRGVIAATRKTASYCKALEDGERSRVTEQQISMLWTSLSFRLKDVGQGGLAKRCDIKGRYWADARQFTPEFLELADISLESVDRLARRIEAQIQVS